MTEIRLADEFFLINHDQLTGKPVLCRDLLGSGLVTALLAELIMEGRLAVNDGRVTLLDPSSHDDQAADFIVTHAATQPRTYPVRTWTEMLDETAYELIARRLLRRGIVRRVRPRRLLGRRRDLFPAARREAVEPVLRLHAVVRNPAGVDPHPALSVVLIATAGAEHVLGMGLDRDRIRKAVAELATGLSPDFTELIAGFAAVVAARLPTLRR